MRCQTKSWLCQFSCKLAHKMASRTAEMPVKLVVSPSDSNKGSSMVENKATLYVNHGPQPYQFIGRPVEEDKEAEGAGGNSQFGHFPYITLVMFSNYFVSGSWYRNTRQSQSDTKKAYKCSIGLVASFLYVWYHRHRESTEYRLSNLEACCYTAQRQC